MKIIRAAVITLLYLASVIIVVDEICRRARLRQVGDGTAVGRIYTNFDHAVIEGDKCRMRWGALA